MWDRFTKAREREQQTPSYYFKAMFAGYLGSACHPLENLPLLRSLNAEDPTIMNEFLLSKAGSPNMAASSVMSGAVRFGFYEIIKNSLNGF